MSFGRAVLQTGYRAAIASILLVSSTTLLTAQVMQSGSYQIQSDSLNMGGGYSTSTTYSLESTVGEVASGLSSSTNYQLKAGYQQMQEVYLSMSAIADVVMSPAIGGLTGGTANGTTSFLVTTDAPAGYSVSIAASAAPAMRYGSYSIADYVPAGAVPDYTFSIAANEAQLAFSPEGVNLATRYQDSVGVCGVTGSDTASACWDGLSTTDRTIVSATAPNHPNGATTTIRFRVGVGASSGVVAGDYVATTTVTALPL